MEYGLDYAMHRHDIERLQEALVQSEEAISSMSGVINEVWEALNTMYMLATDYLNEMPGEMHEEFAEAITSVEKTHRAYDSDQCANLDNDGCKYSGN